MTNKVKNLDTVNNGVNNNSELGHYEKFVSLSPKELKGINASTDYWNRIIEMTINITSMYADVNSNRIDFFKLLVKQACRFGVHPSDLTNRIHELYNVCEDESKFFIDNFYDEEQYGRDWFLLTTIFFKNKPSLETAPEFPTEIYDSLPVILKKSIEVIPAGRQRDMFLLSALSVLSGCIHNFTGLYDGKEVYPNIYSFIVAPAASGKGVTQYAKRLGQKYHRSLLDEWKDAVENFKSSKNDDEESGSPEPAAKLLYLPANSSAAAFIEKLKGSCGRAVMFETEADTISSTLKNDWGGYSELMRVAFHHETISVNRKGKDGLLEIEKPRLSIAISGTPAQVGALHKSQENGLFSRFAFYAFSDVVQWKDVSPGYSVMNKEEYFDGLSSDVLEFVKFCEAYPANFTYLGCHWEELNERYRMLMDYFGLHGNNNDFQGVLIRHGLIRYRISMVLSALRRFDAGEKGGKCECDVLDFEIAEKISDVLLTHSIITMDLVPKTSDPSMGNSEEKFYKRLPDKFDRLEAVEIGKSMNLKPRSCDGYLKKLVDKCKLEKTANGRYSKL